MKGKKRKKNIELDTCRDKKRKEEKEEKERKRMRRKQQSYEGREIKGGKNKQER